MLEENHCFLLDPESLPRHRHNPISSLQHMSNQTPDVASELRPNVTSDVVQSTARPTVEWNGDPMDWKSWPHGRPGPYVSKIVMRQAMDFFRSVEKVRNEWSRTEEKVFHIADYSSTGKGWSLLCISYSQFNNKPFRGICWARYRAAVGQLVRSESPSRPHIRHSLVYRTLNLKVLIDSCE
jgi:hypothetical protein